jgi:hypothetical protein
MTAMTASAGPEQNRTADCAQARTGTSSALQRLLSRARALELSLGFVDPFYDIDVYDDLTRLAAKLLAPERAPRTAMWLKEWERAAAQFRTGTGEL